MHTPQNYLSFLRGKSILKQMLFHSLCEISIGFVGTLFLKNDIDVWMGGQKKNFSQEIYHGWCHAWLKSVSKLHANTSSCGIYWRKQVNRRASFQLYHRNTDTPERMQNCIALSSSSTEMCAPMQVVKQPEHWRASITEGQKCQMNYD